MASIKNLSRSDYNVNGDYPDPTNIGVSALMRIADAIEIMAPNFVKMQTDLDYCHRRIREQNERIAQLEKSNAALKGHLKRHKNKQKAELPPQ